MITPGNVHFLFLHVSAPKKVFGKHKILSSIEIEYQIVDINIFIKEADIRNDEVLQAMPYTPLKHIWEAIELQNDRQHRILNMWNTEDSGTSRLQFPLWFQISWNYNICVCNCNSNSFENSSVLWNKTVKNLWIGVR